MPKISVVVPVYKVEQYLRRCVDSILSQTFSDFELVLVDDGSPDKCGDICEEYAEKDNRIYVIHRENGGLSAARNSGIDWSLKNSDSGWITFIDSDDWIHPRYLELLYDAVISTGMSVALVDFERTSGENPVVNEDNILIETINTPDLYRDSYMRFITAWGKLYQKSDFRFIRYPEGKLHEDEFTTWKILFKYPQVAVIDVPLYAYYLNDAGITKAKWNSRRVDGLDAQEERLSVIEQTSAFEPFRAKTIQLTAYTMAGYIETLEKEDVPNQKELIKGFRKRLKQFIHQYKKDLPFRGCGWAYGKAYPHLMGMFVFYADTTEKIMAKLKSRKKPE